MLDTVSIWTDDSNHVLFELSTEDGVPFERSSMSQKEWKDLRDSVIATLPANVSISMLIDYLAVFRAHLENC